MKHSLSTLAELEINLNDHTIFGEYTINIEKDINSESPRDWDNLGTMICWHTKYNLGDKHNYQSPKDFYHKLSGLYPDLSEGEVTDIQMLLCKNRVEKMNIILPLYLYDHSGITMKTTPFSCNWDSGLVGFIYIPFSKIREEFSIKRITEKTRKEMTGFVINEVTAYDDYLTGNIYNYEIINHKLNEYVDSCNEMYGSDHEYMINQIKETIKSDLLSRPEQVEMF